MDVLQWKCICRAFFRIKADRDALNRADVIDGTLLVEIRQRDMAAGFINRDGCDRVGIFWINASFFSR